MRPRRAIPLLLAVLPLLVFMSAEEGGKVSATMDFIGKTVNFLILFGGLGFVLRKPLAALLRKLGHEVREAFRTAADAKAAAEGRHAEGEAKIAGLAGEIARMTKTAEEVAERERDRIAGLAAAESERLRKFAEQEIDEMTRAGLQELRTYAAGLATALARERIQARLTEAGQSVLIDDSIAKISELHAKPGPR